MWTPGTISTKQALLLRSKARRHLDNVESESLADLCAACAILDGLEGRADLAAFDRRAAQVEKARARLAEKK